MRTYTFINNGRTYTIQANNLREALSEYRRQLKEAV